MITKRHAIIVLFFLVTTFAFLGSYGQNVTINRKYIYSTSWSNGGYQGFRIMKIKLIDSAVSVFDKNFNRYFLDKHKVDSSFCYIEITDTKSRSLCYANSANWR